MKVLANDGISAAGKKKLESYGFEVLTENVAQDRLAETLNKENIEVLLVRSATTARKDMIDAVPGLKLIGRGGVGMDNIDVEYARGKGLSVVNTPGASSRSVAELVIAHMFSLARSLHQSNRSMPAEGRADFKGLKKAYSKGFELRGKTLGVIGFGRIGRETASYALGAGMNVLAYDLSGFDSVVPLEIAGAGTVQAKVSASSMEQLLESSDIITVHIPAQKDGSAVIDAQAFAKMKDGVVLINAARGGVVDEDALIDAIQNGKVRAAALDVFENEPHPNEMVLKMDAIALSPHIGAATVEAQDRIGVELADQIIERFGAQNGSGR